MMAEQIQELTKPCPAVWNWLLGKTLNSAITERADLVKEIKRLVEVKYNVTWERWPNGRAVPCLDGRLCHGFHLMHMAMHRAAEATP